MNELRARDPFALEPMESMLRSLLRPWRAEAAAQAPQIRLDVHENDAGFTVTAELPGVKKDDIDVRIEGSQVTISAEVRKEERQEQDGRVLRRERQYGHASRSLALGCEIDEARSSAKVQDGVLELSLAKKAGGASQRLSVG
jgi:HSP20 family protein